jgi:uncharacterized protein YqjF (DUF2071 family)
MDRLSVFPPRPVARPFLFQDWCNLTFLHWRCEPHTVQRLLPARLEADTFDGSAWLGMTPFFLRRLRTSGVRPVPWISNFPETNVRTYVRGPDGESGIWFFTLETARLLAAVGARATYGLPYHWARMTVEQKPDGMSYRSIRSTQSGPVGTNLAVAIHDPIARPNELERFLTARFRLYSIRGNDELIFCDVEHEPWPLSRAGLWHVQENLIASLGLPAMDDVLVHFSSGVHTRVGRPTRYDAQVLRPPLIRAAAYKKSRYSLSGNAVK